MSNLDKFKQALFFRVLPLVTSVNLSLTVAFILLSDNTKLLSFVGLMSILTALVASVTVSFIISRVVSEPTVTLWKAILHVSYEQNTLPAPDISKIKVSRELIGNLVQQIYQLASQSIHPQTETANEAAASAQTILSELPLPIFVIDKAQNIVYANAPALQYCDKPSEAIMGKNMYSTLDLSFPSEDTFDVWLENCRANKASDRKSWERVRLNLPEQSDPKQFDLAAFYSKDNPAGYETVMVMFDHTMRYAADDQNLSFIAMAVHELRTPLTILRGYIEVFEDEFSGKLDGELNGFMLKMQASAQQLASFVNNILNVAHVEENQLVLHLNEAGWSDVLREAVEIMRLRAEVHNKFIEVNIAPNLPTVAVDKVSIHEVVYNLLDNAIKYSGDEPKKIIITAGLSQDGQVETTVQDFGVGIPQAVVPNLFDKFYRNHRNRAQIGGTGLGLYLSKAIISAHGGNIWVRSKEGEGSTFGFSLQPYAALAEELKNNDNTLVREAHGWIKNHSMYRR